MAILIDDEDEVVDPSVLRKEKENKEMENERNRIMQSSFNQELASKSRFSGLDWAKIVKDVPITIIGAGGIGSWSTLFTARAGFGTISIYDGDNIEEHNMAGQLYRTVDIGKYKVEAMASIVNQYVSCFPCVTNPVFYTNQNLTNITITGLDNMKARKTVFENWYKQRKNVPVDQRNRHFFVDGRMSVEGIQIFCFRLSQHNRIKNYIEQCLFDDSEFASPACSLKATSHVGGVIGGFLTALITNHIRFGEADEAFGIKVPFYIEIDFSNGILFKTAQSWEKPTKKEE